ncbi:MAG TPA: maleylpyruvate isomerase family mycothiol-dependent enzyme [Streptosporangiaceae bacterium]
MITEERFSAGLRGFTGRLAGVVAVTSEAARIPTCPEWSLRQLATHVGRAHRWAGEMVNRRTTEVISFREAPDGKLPGDPAAWPGWLTAGADRLIAAVGDAGTGQVWTFEGLGPAGFWLRRMAHETAVHCADAELAVGRQPAVTADLAVDGIAEWFGIISGDPGERPAPLTEGATLHVHATDDGLDGSGEWLLSGTASGMAVQPGHAAAGCHSGKESKADAVVRGPAATLFLVLMRRLPPDAPGIEVLGDGSVLRSWLANTAF